MIARYFDSISDSITDSKADAKSDARAGAKRGGVALGEEFRRWVYANQSSINKENLRGMAGRFADQHHLELPANYDPTGRWKNAVLADYALGQQVGVIHTPTVFVVSVSQRSAPFVETLERDKLFATIEQVQATEKK